MRSLPTVIHRHLIRIIICGSIVLVIGSFFLGRTTANSLRYSSTSENKSTKHTPLLTPSPLEPFSLGSDVFLAASASKRYAIMATKESDDSCQVAIMDLSPDRANSVGFTQVLVADKDKWKQYGKSTDFTCTYTQGGYYLNEYEGWTGDQLMLKLSPGTLTIIDPTTFQNKDDTYMLSHKTLKIDDYQSIVTYIPKWKYLLTGDVGYYHGESKNVSVIDESNKILYKIYDPSEYLPLNDGVLTYKHIAAPSSQKNSNSDAVQFIVGFLDFKTHEYKENITSFLITNPASDEPRGLDYKEGNGYIDIYPIGAYEFVSLEDKNRGYFRVSVQ